MPRHNASAIVASASVILVAAGFSAYAMLQQHRGGGAQYPMQAVFMSADGLDTGADVQVAGVSVGRVTSIALDSKAFVTRVVFMIDDRYRLPADTSLSIGSSGFTAADALLVTPGHSKTLLPAEGVIHDTHPVVSLEQSVSQYIFGGGGLGD